MKQVILTVDARYIYVDVVDDKTGRVDPILSEKFHSCSEKPALDYAWQVAGELGLNGIDDRRNRS